MNSRSSSSRLPTLPKTIQSSFYNLIQTSGGFNLVSTQDISISTNLFTELPLISISLSSPLSSFESKQLEWSTNSSGSTNLKNEIIRIRLLNQLNALSESDRSIWNSLKSSVRTDVLQERPVGSQEWNIKQLATLMSNSFSKNPDQDLFVYPTFAVSLIKF